VAVFLSSEACVCDGFARGLLGLSSTRHAVETGFVDDALGIGMVEKHATSVRSAARCGSSPAPVEKDENNLRWSEF
jgi:hypothetical protein